MSSLNKASVILSGIIIFYWPSNIFFNQCINISTWRRHLEFNIVFLAQLFIAKSDQFG